MLLSIKTSALSIFVSTTTNPFKLFMERCLQIPEIIRSICDEATSKTALSIALASRDFLQPGLDSIWSEIDDFEAIVACLPSDLWRIEEIAHAGMSLRTYVSPFGVQPTR